MKTIICTFLFIALACQLIGSDFSLDRRIVRDLHNMDLSVIFSSENWNIYEVEIVEKKKQIPEFDTEMVDGVLIQHEIQRPESYVSKFSSLRNGESFTKEFFRKKYSYNPKWIEDSSKYIQQHGGVILVRNQHLVKDYEKFSDGYLLSSEWVKDLKNVYPEVQSSEKLFDNKSQLTEADMQILKRHLNSDNFILKANAFKRLITPSTKSISEEEVIRYFKENNALLKSYLTVLLMNTNVQLLDKLTSKDELQKLQDEDIYYLTVGTIVVSDPPYHSLPTKNNELAYLKLRLKDTFLERKMNPGRGISSHFEAAEKRLGLRKSLTIEEHLQNFRNKMKSSESKASLVVEEESKLIVQKEEPAPIEKVEEPKPVEEEEKSPLTLYIIGIIALVGIYLATRKKNS